MAKMGRRLYVRGFPDDMDPDRLVDKLQIHFLRGRNGGGEIASVNLKPAEQCAVINFEHSSVALSVFRHRPHILEVDGRKYELSLSYPWQVSQHLDKVIIDVSVTIDFKQLPQGIESMKMLAETFPGLRVHYIKPQMHCSLHGPYPEIHAAVSYLMEFLEDIHATGQESFSFLEESSLHNKKDQFKASSLDHPQGFYVSQMTSKSPEAQSYENKLPVDPVLQGNDTNIEGAHSGERIKDWINSTDMEALSLIMEADIFAYLSSKSKKYRHILQNHGVCVIDVTSEGITTLYLQPESKIKTRSGEENHINQACKELSQLYQQLESNLRRAQIPRSVLCLRKGHAETFKNLEVLLPKVLLSFDQSFVYLVGEMSEVSQAKQILLLGSLDDQEKDLTEKRESSGSNKHSPTSEPDRAWADDFFSVMSPKMSHSGIGPKKRACEEYKLAARFRNSEMGIIGAYPKERGRARECQDLNSTVASTFRPSPPSKCSLGTEGFANCDQNSEMSHLTGEGEHHREDTLLRKMDPLYFTSTLKTSGSKTYSTLPPSTSSNAPSDLDKQIKNVVSTSESSTISTSVLKRVNSFSGLPSAKQVNEEKRLNERSGSITPSNRRTRSSSLSRGETVKLPSSKTVSGELSVPTIMWQYIKVAYHSDIKALLSNVKVSECPKDKKEVLIVLKGTDSSMVGGCEFKLQELVDIIASDFCVKQLKLADLGLTEFNDVLEECCIEIHSRFCKILIQNVKDILVLTGPKSLCLKATKIFEEVFQGELSNSGPLESIDQGPDKTASCLVSLSQTSVKTNTQTTPSQTKPYSKNTEENMAGKRKAYQSDHWKSSSELSRKPVVKEKIKNEAFSNFETGKSGTLESKSSRVSEEIRDDEQKPLSLVTQKRIGEASVTGKQINYPISSQPETCVCGKSSLQVVQTSCGVFLCPRCLQIHAQCTMCSKVKAARESSLERPVHSLRVEQNAGKVPEKESSKEQKREQGIHGTMTIVELSLTLPGHDRYPTAKITYCIPDGIQGEEHPNPGSPFQGGVFEAYLPLNSKGRALLQCLDKAFTQGLIFTVCSGNNTGSTAKVGWSRIPHKTNISGGKSGNGYPDSAHLTDLSEALKACGIEAV